jgi:hypothetical protein
MKLNKGDYVMLRLDSIIHIGKMGFNDAMLVKHTDYMVVYIVNEDFCICSTSDGVPIDYVFPIDSLEMRYI